ncbi:MAG: NAD-binding protein [Planctomycetota bacterium]|nr:NAD-binding protein [Planctomycetota bacterium]
MRVIICGAGMVGGVLAERMLKDKHDTVVIDEDKEVCDKLYAETGVVAIHGNSATLEALREAEAEKADLVVAVTNDDAVNLSCSLLSKSLGVKQIIVRVNDPSYERAYEMAGVSAMVWGTDLVVNQVAMEIRHPRARNITSIAENRANIFSVEVPENAAIKGKTIQQLTKDKRFPEECVFIAVYNDNSDRFYIPRGSNKVCEGDHLYMISAEKDMERLLDIITEPGKQEKREVPDEGDGKKLKGK